MKLTHSELISLIHSLKLVSNEKGLCYAIALNCEIAIVLGQTKELFERFNLISKLIGEQMTRNERLAFIKSGGVTKKIEDAKEQIKVLESKLTGAAPEEKGIILVQIQNLRKISDIEIFCQNISVAFFPDYYSRNMDVFEHKITGFAMQNDKMERKILDIISPKALVEQGGMAIPFSFKLCPLGQNRIAKLNIFFWLLSKIEREIYELDKDVHMAINISGFNHGITSELRESKLKENYLLMMDPNRLPFRTISPSRIGDTLVGKGFPVFNTSRNKNSLWETDEDPLINFLEIRIKTTGKKAELVKGVFEKHLQELELCNNKWLPSHFAAYSGNLDLLKELKEDPKNFVVPDSKGNTPVSIAIQNNHWSLTAHYLFHTEQYVYKNTEEKALIISHRNALKIAFFQMLDTVTNPEIQFDLIADIINQKNMLGKILLCHKDSIANEIIQKFRLIQSRFGLFGEKKPTPETSITILLNLLKNEPNPRFLKDYLSDPVAIKGYFHSITYCLFNESNPDIQMKASEVCAGFLKLSDEPIRINLKKFLGDDPMVERFLNDGDLSSALYTKAIVDLASLDSSNNDKKIGENDREKSLLNFYSDPNHLRTMLSILSKAENDPEMVNKVKLAYSVLNRMW